MNHMTKEKEENKVKRGSFEEMQQLDFTNQVEVHKYLAQFIPPGEDESQAPPQWDTEWINRRAKQTRRVFDAPQKYKYCNGDPEEAFREALKRSEESFRKQNEDK